VNNKRSVQDKILEIINSNIENVKIASDQAEGDLSQLGMDSIKFISIIVAMEEAFGIEVPDEKLLITEMGTLNKMIDVVSTALGITE
jgi:acyl carrier protein